MYPLISFSFFDITITVSLYTVFATIGALATMIYIYNHLVGDVNFTFRRYVILIVCLAIGVALGSKTLFIITCIPDIVKNFSLAYAAKKIITAGFVFYGGLTGAILALIAFSKYFRIDFINLSEKVCPAFPLFHTFGRLGCFFAGCCYGKVIESGFYHLQGEEDISRIPIQLIESGGVFFIFCIIIVFQKYRKDIPVLFVYLFLYSILRFILEFYRGDEIRGIWIGLSTSQWVALFYFLLSAICIYNLKRRNIK